jgi:hypothetical protein
MSVWRTIMSARRTVASDVLKKNIHGRTERREDIGAHWLWLLKHLEISSIEKTARGRRVIGPGQPLRARRSTAAGQQ